MLYINLSTENITLSLLPLNVLQKRPYYIHHCKSIPAQPIGVAIITKNLHIIINLHMHCYYMQVIKYMIITDLPLLVL